MVLKNISSKEDLDPEIMKIRDDIIAKIGDKPLDEINLIVKKLLNNQMDENTRLGLLAARLKIIRLKIENLYENKLNKKLKPKIVKKIEKNEKIETSDEHEFWTRIKLLESTEVNGKQIDKDVILDVKKTDGDKLVKQAKAEFVQAKEDKDANKEKLNKDKKAVDPDKILKKNNETKPSLLSSSDDNTEEKEEKSERKNEVQNKSSSENIEKADEKKDITEEKESNNNEIKKTLDLKSNELDENTSNEKKDLLKQHEEKNEVKNKNSIEDVKKTDEKKDTTKEKEFNNTEIQTTPNLKSSEPDQNNLNEKKGLT